MKSINSRLTCERARVFPIEKALAKLGHFPVKTAEKEVWFLSPFRSETQASFKVSKIKNRWYDHGEGVGGNVIDLVCRILKCSVKEALEFLNQDWPSFSFQQPQHLIPNETSLTILKVRRIRHPALIQYLNLRGIPLHVANTHCYEVWYSFKNSKFFGIGLLNNKGGWELRNRIFKNSSSPKSYTYLQRNNEKLIVLEGMFDFLSLAVLNEALINNSDILVLNSLAFVKDIDVCVSDYELVHLYLDNDEAGRKMTLYLTNEYNHAIDESSSYKNHNDLNDFLCHERKGRD
ncbi:DNA primase [Gelidibacter salicanalis]|uniref:DNA primase n=1 Tax=Gelidibacter salicanalis TaxID=291193 RepID=A0A5C7AI26_9FLAO|nr:toprim domain-containing protein [Gelidibacter salicanalis]TXE08406.1 DNA primase [Gelidibacter salicanalis]